MPTPDELRTAIAEGRQAFRDALSAAAAGWERQPGGTGEEAWSARQVAEHVIPAEAFFTTAVCKACGYPGVDRVTGSYATAQDAIKHFDEVVEMCNKKLKYVSETDLEKKHERLGTSADVMAMNANHLVEHAAQVRAAAGA